MSGESKGENPIEIFKIFVDILSFCSFAYNTIVMPNQDKTESVKAYERYKFSILFFFYPKPVKTYQWFFLVYFQCVLLGSFLCSPCWAPSVTHRFLKLGTDH